MLECVKMNGNGNDFLVIDNMDKRYDTDMLSRMAVTLCRRRESIGGDGILVTEPSDCADFKMRLFNRDGSEGEMCGNGSRCVARFAYDRKIAKSADMVFETLGGNVRASVKDEMATLKLAPVLLKDVKVSASASVNGETFNYTFLTVGVPHTVIFEKIKRTDEEYRVFGRAVRNMSDLFPDGTNVNFAVPREGENDVLDVTTYERGVEDLTLSCGTGSTASAIAAVLIGLSGPKVDVWNPGGLNRVTVAFESSDTALPELEGRAAYVADVKIFDEAMRQI